MSPFDEILRQSPSPKRDKNLADCVKEVARVGPHEERDVCAVFAALAAIEDDGSLVDLLVSNGNVRFMFNEWYPEDKEAQAHWTAVNERAKLHVHKVAEALAGAKGDERAQIMQELVEVATVYPKQVVPTLLDALHKLDDHDQLVRYLDTPRLCYILTRHGGKAFSDHERKLEEIYERAAEEANWDDPNWEAKRDTLSASDMAAYNNFRCEKAAVLTGRGYGSVSSGPTYSHHGKEFEEEVYKRIRHGEAHVCENVLLDVENFCETMRNCTKKGREVHILALSVETGGIEGFEYLTRCDMDVVILRTADDGKIALTVMEIKSSKRATTASQSQAVIYAAVLEKLIEQKGEELFVPKVDVKMWLKEGPEDCNMSLAAAGMQLAQKELCEPKLWKEPKQKLNRDCVANNCGHLKRCREATRGFLSSITGELPDIEELVGCKASQFRLDDWMGLGEDKRHAVVGVSPVKFSVDERPEVFSYRTSKRLRTLAEKADTLEVFVTDLQKPSTDGGPDAIYFTIYHEGTLSKVERYDGLRKYLTDLRKNEFSSNAVQVYTLRRGTALLYAKHVRVKNPPKEESDIPTFTALSDIIREMCVVPVLCGDLDVVRHLKEKEMDWQGKNDYESDPEFVYKLLQHLRERAVAHSLRLSAPPKKRDFMADGEGLQTIAGIVTDPTKPDLDNAAADWIGYQHKRLAQEKLSLELRRRQNARWSVLECTLVEKVPTTCDDEEEQLQSTSRDKVKVKLVPVRSEKFGQTTDLGYELLNFEDAMQNKDSILCDVTKNPRVKLHLLGDELYLDLKVTPHFKKGTFWVLRRRAAALQFIRTTVSKATGDTMSRLFEAANPERCNSTPPYPPVSLGSIVKYSKYELTPDQRELVAKVSKNRLVVSCGPPGSGKSVAACAAVAHLKKNGVNNVCIVSHNLTAVKLITKCVTEDFRLPTGIVNLYGKWEGRTDAGVVGMSLEAYSAAERTYKCDVRGTATERSKIAAVPEKFDAVVVDEASQVEGYCLATLLSRLEDNGRLVVLGDPLQLGVNRPVDWDMPEGIPDISGSLLQSLLRTEDNTVVKSFEEVKGKLAPYIVKQNQYLRSDKAISELTRCLYSGPKPTVEKALSRKSAGMNVNFWSKNLNARLRGLLTVVVHSKDKAWDVAKALASYIQEAYEIEAVGESPKVHIISKTKNRERLPPGIESATIEGCQGMTTDVVILALERFRDDSGDRYFCKQSMMNVCFSRASRLAVLVHHPGYTPHPSIAQDEDCRKGFAHIQEFMKQSETVTLDRSLELLSLSNRT